MIALKNINEEELAKFKHIYPGRVQFSEVDSFGVTHNLVYFYWLEWARTDYLRNLGTKLNTRTFLKKHPLMSVHSEIDYFASSRFDDEYEVLTRIKWVKNSSLCFDNIIRLKDGELLVFGSSILVNVNPATQESVPISEEMRQLIKDYEKTDVIFLD